MSAVAALTEVRARLEALARPYLSEAHRRNAVVFITKGSRVALIAPEEAAERAFIPATPCPPDRVRVVALLGLCRPMCFDVERGAS